ncbi:MAG: hypothetical protein HYR55_05025 [Acidobacteria bacterium]|nr:hypothetical protein [Acidobacteriota bacterium]
MATAIKSAALALWLLLTASCATEQDFITVVEERIQAIQRKNFDAYLKSDYYYVADTDMVEENQPKIIWEKEKAKLKLKYKSRFEDAINQVPIQNGSMFNFNPSGIFLYPKMRWKILEVRRGGSVQTTNGKNLTNSKVFVECEFEDKAKSPLEKITFDPYASPRFSHHGKSVKKTIVAFNVVTALAKPTIVDNGEVKEGREYF